MTNPAAPSSGPSPVAADGAPATTIAQRAEAIGEALGRRGFVPAPRFASRLWQRPAPHRCTVTLTRQSRTRYVGEVRYRKHLGFRVRIDLDCEVPSRFYLVQSKLAGSGLLRRIWSWRGLQLVEKVPAAIDGHVMLAREADWAGALLLEEDAIDAIADLLSRHAGRLAGSVYLEPGVLAYASPILDGTEVESGYVEDMLDGLETLRDACERLPRPSRPLRPSRLQAFARDRPLAAALALIGALMGCLFTLSMVLFALVIGLGAILQSIQ